MHEVAQPHFNYEILFFCGTNFDIMLNVAIFTKKNNEGRAFYG